MNIEFNGLQVIPADPSAYLEIPRRAAVRLALGLASTTAAAVLLLVTALSFSAPGSADAASAHAPATAADLSRGRYLVQIAGCNDCHTPGYAEAGGQVPLSNWLTGVPVGFQGPWGTSYAANLRITLSSISEEQWLLFARAQRLPPMPWFNLRDMSDDDLRAMYRFIRSLGAAGERMPPPVAPGGRVTTPFITMEPQSQKSVAESQAAPAPAKRGS